MRLYQAMVPILESFCPNAKCEIALINTIQVTCHDDAHFTKAFPNVLKVSVSRKVTTVLVPGESFIPACCIPSGALQRRRHFGSGHPVLGSKGV